MNSEQHADKPSTPEPFRPTRAQRIVAAGFLFAFALTIITVLLTGLWVRSPSRRGALEEPPAATERGQAAGTEERAGAGGREPDAPVPGR
jgi:hypothetical protein